MENLEQPIDNIPASENVGYHVGGIRTPSESLKSRGWYFGNKVGYMGTGFFFFGNLEDAEDLQKQIKGPIYQVKLSSYNLYKPANAVLFYQDIKQVTQLLGKVRRKYLKTQTLIESLVEIADIFRNEHGIGIPKKELVKILYNFILDVQNKQEGTLLTNRLLEPLGYDGVDNRGNDELDHYGVGSVLFHIDPNTVTQIA
jgi:hypothetical protein